MRERTGGGIVYLVCAVLAVALLVYSQTLAFAWDEGFHLLASQSINRGKTPYLDFLFPQPPFNAYWVAWWMRVFGESWRTAQALAALETAAAIALVAEYLMRRFPDAAWRQAAALTAVLTFGLNAMVVEFGTEGQAYGLCLLLGVLAFRSGIKEGWKFALASGFFASGAAGASLLAAPVTPVLFLWLLYYRPGKRWMNGAAFSAGVLLRWIPVIQAFVKAPAIVWFGLAGYNILYRRNGWGDPTEHDIGVLTAWIDSAQALTLGLLAISGLVFVARKSGWEQRVRSEFYLCAWLAAAEMVHLSFGRPTFERYFLLTVPFLSILAAAGLWGRNWVLVVAGILMSLGLGKALYEERDAFTWPDFERIARKVDEVTPKNGSLLADEHVYFLTKRPPPSGMELDYSHRLLIPDEFAKQLHVVLRPELNRRIHAGAYDTIATCEPEKADAIGIPALYRNKTEVSECEVFWGFKK